MKKYRLLKDLPGCPAGEIFCSMDPSIKGNEKFFMPERFNRTIPRSMVYGQELMEDPDWSEEMKEEYKGMTAKKAIRQYAADSEEFKQQMRENHELQNPPKEARRRAPAYVWRNDPQDFGTGGMYSSQEEAEADLKRAGRGGWDNVQWSALPDKDGYYPGPKR